MSNYLTTDTELTSVADAIRAKGGTSAPLTYPDGFVSAIGAISTGAQSVPYKDVNLCDYDGTVLHSYTAEEFAELSALPENPTHDRLIEQGWNWALADAQAHVASRGFLEIGQTYKPTDGKTHLFIDLMYGRTSLRLGFAINGSAIVDWGDGSDPETVTGNSLSTIVYTPHEYAKHNPYEITIGVTGTLAFCDNILTKASGSAAESYVYMSAIKEIWLGENVLINSSAFRFAEGMKKIVIPMGITTISSAAFRFCYQLSYVCLPYTVTAINGQVFGNIQGLSAVSVPKNAVYVSADDIFTGCATIRNAFLHDGLTKLFSSMFNVCASLTRIVVPSTVTSIQSQALNGCCGLAELRFLPTTPPSVPNSNAFTNVPTDCKIIVPYSADHSILTAYKAATNYPDPATYTYEEASA